MKLFIENSRFIEGICEITAKIVTAQFGEGFDIEDDGSGGTKYTDEAQDFFNEQYDEVETLVNNVMQVFSSNELEDNEAIFKEN